MRSQRDKIGYRIEKSLEETKRLLENVFIVKPFHLQGFLLFYKSRYCWSRGETLVYVMYFISCIYGFDVLISVKDLARVAGK